MKDLVKIVLVFAGIYLVLRFAPAIPFSSVVTQKQAFFTSTGTGKVSAVPDTAEVSLGISLSKPTVKEAQSSVNSIINSITGSLKKLGIDDKDIKTENYSVYPQYDYTNNANHITGYSVSTTILVTVRNLDLVNQVIDTSTTQGAHQVSGIQFTVADDKLKQLQQQARDLAVADAKTKAGSLASSAGLILGRIVNVEENSPETPRPIMFAGIANASLSKDTATQVQPGSTDITSSVTLSYETR